MAFAKAHSSLEDSVLWSYRLLLGREPESAEVLQRRAHRSVAVIRRIFMQSDEFGQRAAEAGARVPESKVLKHFAPWTGAGGPDFWRDFIGVRTRCDYLPETYGVLSGTVQGPAGTEQAGVLEVAEWIGSLRSVLEARARGVLVAVKLGAGWGPWLVGAAKAAERVGIRDVRLAGVEGTKGHIEFMRQHFRDNRLDPDVHLLIHGVVGVRDGTASFPRLANPRSDYGSMVVFDAKLSGGDALEEVRCIALTTLLNELPSVDLIHCDAQGAEKEVLTSAREALEGRVRRMIVGTHSRRIEVDLLDFFTALDWRLEDERVCGLIQAGGNHRLTREGYQVWANPRRG